MMPTNIGRTKLSWGARAQQEHRPSLCLWPGRSWEAAGDSGLLHTASETYLAIKALSTRIEVEEKDSHKHGLEHRKYKTHKM